MEWIYRWIIAWWGIVTLRREIREREKRLNQLVAAARTDLAQRPNSFSRHLVPKDKK